MAIDPLLTKVDSNLTGLRYAHETSIGVVKGDGTDVWFQLDPNSYSGFGAQMTLTERSPINPARMRRKGVITDLAADAGFQMDLTKTNARDLLPGFFFAAWTDKYTLFPTSVTATQYVVPSGGATFVTTDLIFGANFAIPGNNGLKAVSGSASTTVSAGPGLAIENTAGYTPGAQPYIRRVGFQGGSGDISVTETGVGILMSSLTVTTPGGSVGAPYIPGTDVLTLSGGTFSVVAKGNVVSTQVSLATVAAGGSTGAANGPGYIVQGTTGTGTKFQASVTITTGAIASVQSITVGGDYTVNPTVVATEPVTGIGFVVTGATLAVSMGVKRLTVNAAGTYTEEPAEPVATTNTGTGTGATVNPIWSPLLPLSLSENAATGNTSTLKSVSLDFTTLGLQAGEWIFVGGDTSVTQFNTAADKGFARIVSVAAHAIVVDKTGAPWEEDAGTAKTIQVFFGSFLKNEVLPANIVRDTLMFERTLSTGGTEYVKGCVPDMFTITMNAATKVTCELKYVGTQTENLAPNVAVKPGFRPLLPVSQAYNTTSDFGRLSLYDRQVGSSLANFMKDTTLVINNGAQPVKALSRLGAIDVVVGDFQVGGAVTAYFTDTATVNAVKANDDVTMDFALVHGNSGMLFDVPLMAVGGGRLNVVKDQPIEIPLTKAGAWDPTYNWVLSCSMYDYLPNLATS